MIGVINQGRMMSDSRVVGAVKVPLHSLIVESVSELVTSDDSDT